MPPRWLGVSRPAVDLWLDRDGAKGIALTGRGVLVATSVQAWILALGRTSPPVSDGLPYWSSREVRRSCH
jgi:hypothetical protein